MSEERSKWTVNGPDPEGEEVPEYLTIARNHLATRNIENIEKRDASRKKANQNWWEDPVAWIFIVIVIFLTICQIAGST